MTLCIWEDCDSDAVYCPGHALEYADVGHESEARKLRTKAAEVERAALEMQTSDSWAIRQWGTHLLQILRTPDSAEPVLCEHGWKDRSRCLICNDN